MPLNIMTAQEMDLAVRALGLVAYEVVIEDDELQTVTGFTRDELKAIHQRLKDLREDDLEAVRAIGQCLNNLTGYPHGKAEFVEQKLHCSATALDELTAKWFGRETYFDRLT